MYSKKKGKEEKKVEKRGGKKIFGVMISRTEGKKKMHVTCTPVIISYIVKKRRQEKRKKRWQKVLTSE